MLKLKKEQSSFINTLVVALLCAGLIRSCLFEPFHIPSGSMKPNLLVGDYVIVTKYSYGYSRFSFPFGFRFFDGRFFFGEAHQPKRGDVVVFRYPNDPSINYIKRIIGLPGDSVQMRSGVLYINDQKIEKTPDGLFYDQQENGDEFNTDKYIETFSDGKKVSTLDLVKDAPQDDTAVYEVPDGYYFMMGDNRDNSQDSRFLSQVGYVSAENLVGKARFIFFSSSEPVWKLWKWSTSIRLERIFKKID